MVSPREKSRGPVRLDDDRLEGAPSEDQVIDEKHSHGADRGDQQAVKIEACDPGASELIEDKTADYGPHDPKDEIEHQSSP
jgi:hypothetical protein